VAYSMGPDAQTLIDPEKTRTSASRLVPTRAPTPGKATVEDRRRIHVGWYSTIRTDLIYLRHGTPHLESQPASGDNRGSMTIFARDADTEWRSGSTR